MLLARLTCLSAVVLLGAPGPAEDQPIPLFRSGSQLVEVTVVVKDHKGANAAGLKAQDFEIYDNGERQDVRVFRVNDYSSRPGAPTLCRDEPTGGSRLSNRPALTGESPNPPTILVIDAGNSWNIARMTWPDLVFARKQVVRFLEQLQPHDRLGIYLMGTDKFFVLQEYDEECAQLLERLAAWKRGESNERGVKYPDLWTEFAVKATQTGPDMARRIHKAQFYEYAARNPALPITLDSLSLLEGVAAHLRYVPGRKNVIFISSTAFLPSDYSDALVALRNILGADVAIYAIDPGGLAPYALDASVAIPAEFRFGPYSVQKYVDGKYALNRQVSLYLKASLTELAVSTGGQVFVDTNDIFGAIRTSFDDSQVSYTLGFYPTNARNDGAFHSLKVKTPGRSDLETRYRGGYFAPAPPSTDPSIHHRELLDLAKAPLDQSAIELSATVSPAQSAGSYDLQLKIGLPGIWLLVDNGRWAGKIEMLMVQRDPYGGEFEQMYQTLGLNLQQSTFEQAAREGFGHVMRFRLAPEATSARVVVRDLNTGNTGTLTIPLESILGTRK